MKGLIIKDIKIILKNTRFIFILVMIAVVFCTQLKSDNYGFTAGYIVMIFSMFALNTLAFDEQDKSITFLLTLPVNRNAYVTEKYIISFGFSFLGSMLVALLFILMQPQHTAEILLSILAIFAVEFLFTMIMIPMRLKFGSEKSGVVLIVFVFLIFALFGTINVINSRANNLQHIQLINPSGAKNFISHALNAFLSLNEWVIGAALFLLWLVLFAISYLISIRIMRNKEF